MLWLKFVSSCDRYADYGYHDPYYPPPMPPIPPPPFGHYPHHPRGYPRPFPPPPVPEYHYNYPPPSVPAPPGTYPARPYPVSRYSSNTHVTQDTPITSDVTENNDVDEAKSLEDSHRLEELLNQIDKVRGEGQETDDNMSSEEPNSFSEEQVDDRTAGDGNYTTLQYIQMSQESKNNIIVSSIVCRK